MIRYAEEKDKNIISEMLIDMWLVHKNAQEAMVSEYETKESMMTKLDYVFEQSHLTHFVYENDSVQGYMMLAEHEHPDYLVLKKDKTIIIDVLITHPDYRKQGIASSMIEYAKQYAESKGYKSIGLDVMVGLESTKKLYQKLGFSSVFESMKCFI